MDPPCSQGEGSTPKKRIFRARDESGDFFSFFPHKIFSPVFLLLFLIMLINIHN